MGAMWARGKWVGLWAALGAAALTPAGASAAAPACQIERVASLPLDLERHLAMVSVQVNGSPVWMGIDTGAQTSLLTADAAARLGLPHDRTRRTNVVSGAGTTLVQNVRVNDLQVGDVMFSDLSLAAVDLPQPSGAHRWADGLIGADILADYDVELDFVGGTLGLYRVSGCPHMQPPWQGAYVGVPATLTRTHLLLLPVQIDGQDAAGLFDSGSDRERVAHAAALRVGVTDAMLARDPDSGGLAAGGASRVMRVHHFRLLRIGADSFAAPIMEVGSLPDPTADMLIGLDYMRTRRFWLSYATRTVFIQQPPH